MRKSIKNFFGRFFNVIELKSPLCVAIVLICVCVIMLFAAGSLIKGSKSRRIIAQYGEKTVGAEAFPFENTESEKIYIHIKGEVKSPGLYTLDTGSRVYEAVEMAGGLTENAEINAINLAKILRDEEELIIPAKGGTDSATQTGSSEKTRTININRATAAELESLPGIGEAYAKSIIEYRDKNGAFKRKEDIMNVRGISKNRFEQIKDLICT